MRLIAAQSVSRPRSKDLARHRVILRLMHDDVVRHRHLRALLALRVVGLQDLDLDPHDALAKEHVPRALLDEEVLRLAGGDQVSVLELHHLRPLLTHLARDGHLAALGAVLHHEAHHAVARAANDETTEQLEAQRLALSHHTQATVLHALREELDRVLREAEALLHHRRELPNTAALLAENLTSTSRADDDLRADGCHAHLGPREPVLGQRPLQELVELRVENAISHELALLRDRRLTLHCLRSKYHNTELSP